MKNKDRKLNLLVLDMDPEWRTVLEEAAARADLKRVKFIKDLENVTTVIRSAPDVVLWNIRGMHQFNLGLQDMILARFPNTDVAAAVHHINETDVVSMLQAGISYICDKEERPDEFLAMFLQFLGLEKKLRQQNNPIEVSYNLRHWVDLSAPSEAKFVESLARFVEVLTRTTLDERKRRSLVYALREIGQNAVEWGNAYQAHKQFHMSFCVMKDRILVKLADEGEGFNVDGLSDPRKNHLENLLTRRRQGKRSGGYGIAIVRGLMDQVLFNENGNAVVMAMHLEAPALER